MKTHECDFLIIGSGLGGLATALHLSRQGTVHILSKEKLDDTNTRMAQGGIASVSNQSDSFEQHIQDTLKAGAGLCHNQVVQKVIESAPQHIKQLQSWGVQFDKQESENKLSLNHEGGHSHRRILHVGDQTGRSVHLNLLKAAQLNDNIKFFTHHIAVDLILNTHLEVFQTQETSCVGCYVFDSTQQEVVAWKTRATILATGGAGKTYLYTSNWSGATGDGVAMAFRAGAHIANMEFMQFHPTCLYHPEAKNFLISEALRGEGAKLINIHGEAFMEKQHPLAELAPRDAVARGIDGEIKKTGATHVYLDITHKSKDFLKTHFPIIYKRCLDFGLDISTSPIPVIPAAHYLCGGVITDEFGRTNIKNLFAVGEVSCTGLHGANRLASNSLLECTAYAHNIANYLDTQSAFLKLTPLKIKDWVNPKERDDDELIVISHIWDEIRRLMWNYVGIVRSNKRLMRAQYRLDHIRKEIKEYYRHFQITQDLIELRNIALVAKLTVESALSRQESVGIHYNIDTPPKKTDQPLVDTIITPGRQL